MVGLRICEKVYGLLREELLDKYAYSSCEIVIVYMA